MDKLTTLKEIKSFLDGYNGDLKYLVNFETDPNTNYAECVIHEPNKEPRIEKVYYEPFLYMKDLTKHNIFLYPGKSDEFVEGKKKQFGITIKKLKTGNQKRLVNGFCYKITSSRSYNDIVNFLTDAGINPNEKVVDGSGKFVRDKDNKYIYKNREYFYSVTTNEQFLINTKARLFKGFDEYKDVHKLTFDIETTGLRYQISRVFAIGVRDNRGFETILEVEERNDDLSEIRLIQDFFNLINILKPAVISGYNSEVFDFEFLLGRADLLGMKLENIPTTLKQGVHLKRRPNTSFKYGSTVDKYTSTQMWGYSVIDILHAVKKTVAINSDLRESKLKYISKQEKVAKENRTYIDGEDGNIGKFFNDNNIFMINDINQYCELPKEYQELGKKLLTIQLDKNNLTDDEYKKLRNSCLNDNRGFIEWFNQEVKPKNMNKFIDGKRIVKQYLLDDLYETEKIDELYNQSSFMLAKIVPTTYQRVCTMGTASIWNLLLTTWSYENDLAIPYCDKNEKFSGGLARCYKSGYSKRIVKIDYASLYPMIQLTEDVFPMFDITGVIKKMLLYLTTTRNIFKKIANGDELNNEEITLLNELDHTIYDKYLKGELTSSDTAMAKIKQLPIKILNNSLFGALGSGISFNWSDNICAARITCTGRLHLRHAVRWFNNYKCIPLLAVTDGINFQIPDKTNIRVTDDGVFIENYEDLIENMWLYNGKNGIAALIAKYNKEVKDFNESVTFDSPVYIKDNNDLIDIVPICELFNENSKHIDETKERDFEEKSYKILTKTGWSKINYVFKHKTKKDIFRIETKDRLINITEDHSIFQNGREIKPINLKRGDNIDIVDIPINNDLNNIDYDLAWLYGFFFGDGSSIYAKRIKKQGDKIIKNGIRKSWKISNTNIEYLNKCIDIFYKTYGIKLNIINRKQSQIKSNNKLILYEIVSFNSDISEFYSNNFYTSYREKKIPKEILNSSDDVKRNFIYGALASDGYYLSLFDVDSFSQKSQIAMAGFSYLLNSVKCEYTVSTRKDKENIISFRFNTIERKKFLNYLSNSLANDSIFNIKKINKYNNTYVYDVSTEDETFVSGIGGILCHNTSGKVNYISVDNDGESISCLNLSRINYATLSLAKDKKTGELKEKVKLTGNTIKSKTMPEYIEDFIDKGLKMILLGKGDEFVNYYLDYAENIRFCQIPLKKIASKSKIKTTIGAYQKRGKDKNGREKGMQAHMELLIEKRNKIAEELFEKHKNEFDLSKYKKELTIQNKMDLVSNYMPQEPELDSVVYYVNTGYKKSHGDSRKIVDKNTGLERFCASLINNEDLQKNPNMIGEYNYEKYLDAFNKRVKALLMGFDVEIRDKILIKLNKKGEVVKSFFTSEELQLKNFDLDDLESSMYLESLETKFWNKTGYDPRLIWDGFKVKEDNKIYYEIYENALNYLNDLMVKSNKPKIKSVNDKYSKGDLILLKNDFQYDLALYNGTFLEIIRENVAVPKSELELELERIEKEKEEKIKLLKIDDLDSIIKLDDDQINDLIKLKEDCFMDFKKLHKIPVEFNMDEVFSAINNSEDVFNDYFNKILIEKGFVNDKSDDDELDDDYVDFLSEYDY